VVGGASCEGDRVQQTSSTKKGKRVTKLGRGKLTAGTIRGTLPGESGRLEKPDHTPVYLVHAPGK